MDQLKKSTRQIGGAMKTLTISFLIILLAGCANFKNWFRTDQILFTSFTALNVADILQTREAMKDGNGFKEGNQFLDGLGPDGATAVKLGFNGLVYYGMDKNPELRTPGLIILNVLMGACVVHNHNVGVRIKF